MKITREQLKETIRTIMKEESEYQVFFKKALDKTGKSIPDMSDDEKKAFFNKIDAAWDGKGEKKNEGNTFGAERAKAIAKGDDSFKVDGKSFKVTGVDAEDKENAEKFANESIVKEALLPADTKVVNAFFDKKPLEGKNLNTDGKVLKTAGIGSQEMYIHTPKGVKMVGKITGKYAQSLVQFVNKNYKTDLVESINEEKYTVIDPKGNQLGVGLQMQAVSMAKKNGGEKAGYFVVPNKNALKARRALEKFKGDFKNPKLKDMMSDLYYEGKSVNEGRAFINAARKAKLEGLTEFEFNGKKYPVTIKD
jgi:hypothetical protein